MIRTGFVDWKRLLNSRDWSPGTDGITYVYAFWVTDPHAAVFNSEPVRRGPADILTATTSGHVLVPESYTRVFDVNLTTIPLLGAVRAGTLDALLRHTDNGEMFSCKPTDLTRAGQRAIAKLSDLYEQSPVWVTFAERPSDEDTQARPRS